MRLIAVVAVVPGLVVAAATAAAQPVNPKAIPLGDGHTSTTPKVGYVDSCQTHFNPNAGGAQAVGPWVNQVAKTWDSRLKLAINGAVSWPQASFTTKTSGTKRVLTFNDLPIDHTTGTFPVAGSDPAAAYDRNPNHIAVQARSFTLPLNPKAATRPTCVGMGAIGVLIDGVLLYNALDGQGRDAGAHEVLDSCAGHPDQSSTYHHHDIPPCIVSRVKASSTMLVGYALDGYGIYAVKDAAGNLPANSDLDACHGTTSKVVWNGKRTSIYHYVATIEYPYTVGCYHGTPTRP